MPDHIFERISLKQGLSQCFIYNIIQDSHGFMWIGTQDGLNRYDGHNFKIYKHKSNAEDSLQNNIVTSIYEDSSKSIWIGSLQNTFSKYNKEKDNFLRYTVNDIGNSEFNYKNFRNIKTMLEDKSGSILIGTLGCGLIKFNPKENSYSKLFTEGVDKINSNEISSLIFDKSGLLWIGTLDNGLYLYDYSNNKISEENLIYINNCNLFSKTIKCLFEDSRERVWIGTDKGLIVFDRTNKKITQILNIQKNNVKYSITGLCEDKNGDIWIGTRNSGLIKIDKDDKMNNYTNDYSNQYSLSDNSVFSLYCDNTNVLWIGTMGSGLNKVDCQNKKFYNILKYSEDGNHKFLKNVQSIFVDKNRVVWSGTISDGLIKINLDSVDKNNYLSKTLGSDFKASTITDIKEDKNDNIWIGINNKGLFKHDKNKNILMKCSDDISLISICIYDNYIWLGTLDRGLIVYDIITEKIVKDNLFEGDFSYSNMGGIYTLFLDSKNNLWIGTIDKGLFKYDLNNNVLSNFVFDKKLSSSINDNFIIAINEDKEGDIWIGTVSGGLNRYIEENNTFENFFSRDGINESIRGILFDEFDNLWLSSVNGLIKFNKHNKKINRYDFSDGIHSNELNESVCFKSSSGELFFGGVDGITYFHPSEIKDNAFIPNVVITDFEIFNVLVEGSEDNPFLKKNIVYADEINLTYKESVFSFKFASLVFNNPQKNQYAYKMEGFDKEWTYCMNRRRVTYTNLDPGEYVFRVKASNNDGVWNEEGTSVKINISPPYWKTWWFKGIGILGLAAATGITYRQRLEKIEKEKKAQEEFARKLIKSQENERKRIASELHDTIAHDVLISKNKAMMALKHKGDTDKLENALKEISELSSATINDVRNISYNLHPHQLERLGFTKTIKSIIYEVSKSTNISFQSTVDDVDELLTKESEINLFRVVQEAITNIIKHSGASKAEIKLTKFDDFITITVRDNGKGYDAGKNKLTDSKGGFGLSGISERIKFMNGEMNIDSEFNKGTALYFKIPIKINNNNEHS